MRKLLLFILPLLFVTVVIPLTTKVSAAANDTCYAINGGGTTCIQSDVVSIDAQVQDPQFNRYVDNLGTNDTKFAPGQIVLFKIAVQNKDPKKELSKVTVTNTFPQHLTINAKGAMYDEKKRTFTWTIDKLAGNEQKVLYAQGTIAKTIPEIVTCVVNQAVVTVNKEKSQDNTRFCIDKNAVLAAQTKKNPTTTKGGLPVYQPTQSKTTPATGPEMLALVGLAPAAGLGFYLRRKTSRT